MLNPEPPQDTFGLLETNKQFAIAFAQGYGFPVFPVHYPVAGGCSCRVADCPDVGKHPMAKLAPHGFKNATTDVCIISSWFDGCPDANIAFATGGSSGVFVVDVDRKSGGIGTWIEWQDFHGYVETMTVRTGGGGFHYYFSTNGQEFKSSAGKVGPGIDIRAEGGYAILPPSVHASGNAYEFETTGTIASAPDWLVEKLRDAEKPSSNHIPPPCGVKVQEGQRNDYLTRLAGAAVRQGASEPSVCALLQVENGDLDPPLSEKEVAGIAKSVSRYGPSAGPLPEPLMVNYSDDADFDVVAKYAIAGGELVIRAKETRKEKTGVYANVELLFKGLLLGFDTFNVGRLRDRHELSQRCHERLPEGLKAVIHKDLLAIYLDEFCQSLWPNHLKNLAPSLLSGDPDIPITMICGDYIIEGGGTILFGAPGRGKSYTAMNMAISVDAGKHDLWHVKQSNVLYVNLERSQESIQRRIGLCNLAQGLEGDRPLHALNTRGKSLDAVKDVVERYVKENGIELLVLDSISRSGQGDLTGNQETNRTIDLLNNLCPTWLAIGHTPRSDESHVYGSVHFEAGADLMVSLVSEDFDEYLGVGLKVEKSNDTPKHPREKFVFEFGPHGLLKARKAKAGEFEDIDAQPKLPVKNLLEEYLSEHEQISGTQAEAELGVNRGDASHILKNDFSFVFKRKVGRQAMYGLRKKDAS